MATGQNKTYTTNLNLVKPGYSDPADINDINANMDTIDSNIASLLAANRRTRKNITNDLSRLATAVAEQDLGKYGYSIGDYFDGPTSAVDDTNYTYRYTLADMDTFYGGYNAYAVVNTKHITIVVDAKANVKWNEANDTTTGYVGSNLHSYMVEKVLPKVKSDFTSLFGSWSSHLLSHQKLYTTNTASWAWSTDQYISALTSVQIHGANICDMNFYQTGEGNKPLEVFQKFFYPEILGNHNTWLRSIASASTPACADSSGLADGFVASYTFGAVGLIIFH